MRTFEERKEEIMRRSQARIAERKKTVRRVLLAYVPMVLCIAVLSVVVIEHGFGGLDSEAPESAMMPNYSMQDSVEENQVMAPDPVSVQISSGAVTHTSTDPAVLQLFSEMTTGVKYGAAIPESSSETDPKIGNEWAAGGDIIYGDPYPVAVNYPDGSQIWFTLRGSRLTREDGETYMLTNAQAEALYALLEDTP